MKSLLALAGTVALLAPTPPFPAPKLTGVTPDTKCDWGPITEIKPDQTIAVGETVVAHESLASALDTATNNHKDETIFVRADKSLSYGELMEVMNTLRDAGYFKLALVGLATPAAKP